MTVKFDATETKFLPPTYGQRSTQNEQGGIKPT